jgi:hypothetical protein
MWSGALTGFYRWEERELMKMNRAEMRINKTNINPAFRSTFDMPNADTSMKG